MLIGVFHPHNPFDVMTEGRVQATVAEALKQQVQLVFFNESGIDLDARTVEGSVFEEDRWQQGVFPFPQAIMNVRPWGPRRRSDRELIFRKIVPFTAFLIDDKWEITKKLLAGSPALSPMVVPTAVLVAVEQIDTLFETHDKLVVKPINGSRGEGVQALIRRDGFYGLQRGTDWTWMDRREMAAFVDDLNQKYLVQPYIVCLTPDGEPFDFRVLVQRNGEGEWAIGAIYPRIGASDTITSNVSINGRTEQLELFLKRVFPDDHEMLPPILAELGIQIAAFIDAQYAYPLNELGIDLAVDANQRMWFYEANTCPGTLYHEKERAVYAVAYAKYVAEQASRSQSLLSGPSKTLGLLFSSPPSLRDLAPYADVAASYGVQLVYFLLEHVSIRAASISGYRLESQEWVAGVFPFPDAIYNLIDLQEREAARLLYRRTSNVPLTSQEPKGPISASLFFAIASRNRLLAEHLPQTLKPEHSEAAKSFIDRHRSVVMKSETDLNLDDALIIERHPTHYTVQDGIYVHTFDDVEILAFLEMFSDSSYILIPQIVSRTYDGHSLHIRAYLFKRPDGTWETVHIAPLMALDSPDPHRAMPFAVSWEWLLDREFGEHRATDMDLHLRRLARTAAEELEASNRNRIHELILDFSFDHNHGFQLVGGDFEGPSEAIHPYEVARRVIPYAMSLFRAP